MHHLLIFLTHNFYTWSEAITPETIQILVQIMKHSKYISTLFIMLCFEYFTRCLRFFISSSFPLLLLQNISSACYPITDVHIQVRCSNKDKEAVFCVHLEAVKGFLRPLFKQLIGKLFMIRANEVTDVMS
jgi:hypothetical protein